MESFTSKLNEFAIILQTCFTEKVSEWKVSDLQRVIDWADYFRKVKFSYECRKPQECRYYNIALTLLGLPQDARKEFINTKS